MEFTYDKKLVAKYVGMAVFILVIIFATCTFCVMFPWLIAIYMVGIWMVVDAVKRVLEIFNVTILVEREGVHFFRGRKKEFFIPWETVEDFSITSSRCLFKVGSSYYQVSRELLEFDEFERLLVDELSMPLEQRGANLPRLDMPESMGGVRIEEPFVMPSVSEFMDEEGEEPQEELEMLGTEEEEEDLSLSNNNNKPNFTARDIKELKESRLSKKEGDQEYYYYRPEKDDDDF